MYLGGNCRWVPLSIIKTLASEVNQLTPDNMPPAKITDPCLK